ncbi:MAG: hypothetical protein KJ630_06720 [Proteobacteria bacterium]|nr:hypothetical protein [Pseudomonadota bacterium]
MKQKVVSIFSCLAVLVLLVMAQTSFAADKTTVEFTSVEEGGVISIYPDSFPVKRDVKGKVKGLSKDEITAQGVTLELFVLDVSQGPVVVEKNGKWVVKATLNDADLILKAVAKDKTGKELATATIKATASGEF